MNSLEKHIDRKKLVNSLHSPNKIYNILQNLSVIFKLSSVANASQYAIHALNVNAINIAG